MRIPLSVAVMALTVVSCSRSERIPPTDSGSLTYDRLSASQRETIENTLRELGDRCEQAAGRKQSHWPTDLNSLTVDDARFGAKLRWPPESVGAGFSYVVHPRARYGYDASKIVASLKPPAVWVVAYVKPETLGRKRTAALTSDRAVRWMTAGELTTAIQQVDAHWRRFLDALHNLGG